VAGVKNADAFRKVIEEGYNRGNLAALDELFTPDFIEHQDGIFPPKLDGLKKSIRGLRTGFPDLHLTMEEIWEVGDRTIARITATGTHQGQFMVFPPTGKSIRIAVIDICRFRDGKIAEHCGVADRFSVMQQIGVIPGR